MQIPIRKTMLAPAVITFVGALACARPSTLPSPEIPSSEPSTEILSQPIPEKSSSKSWQLSPTTDTRRYTTVVTTNIQQTDGTRDSITTRAQYSLTIARSTTSTLLSGSIDAFTVQAGNRIGGNPPMASFPMPFTGEVQDHALKLNVTDRSQSTSSLPCDNPATSAVTAVERNLFITPLQLQAGMTWQDSLSTSSCSGQLPLNLTILRSYKVLGESSFEGLPAITVEVTEKTLSTGEGSQDQHRIIVNGEGLKSGRFYLDTTNGSLISSSSNTHTTLQIQSSGRTQQFTQDSKETTTRM